MKVLDFGKNNGKVLAACEESYLIWLSRHEKVLAERNRWASKDAKIILERAKCPERKEKKMVKVLIETGSESHTTSSASVVAKFLGGKYDGKMLFEAKEYIASTKWHDSNNKSKRWVETVYELPEGTVIDIIGKGRTGASGADRHEYHKTFIVDASANVLETTINVGLRDTDLKGRLHLLHDHVVSKEASHEIIRNAGF